ncbi:MAG: hypothetical protein PHV34_23815 [Verrucomicrobiae bacterium]|nr:hypothetical protein [Verrucomicrobiae bacterium]
MKKLHSLFALTLLPGALLLGDVQLPSIIGENMVLQRGKIITLWGKANPGEKITATFQSDSAEAIASPEGKWNIKMGTFSAGGPHTLTIKGANTLTFTNVMVGDVWIASGHYDSDEKDLPSAHSEKKSSNSFHPTIRLFTAAKHMADQHLADVSGKWQEYAPDSSQRFPAIPLSFAQQSSHDLQIPIGLINSSHDNTYTQAWVSRSHLLSSSLFAPQVRQNDVLRTINPQSHEDYHKTLDKWMAATQPDPHTKTNRHQDPGNRGVKLGYANPGYIDDDWRKMDLPSFWEDRGLYFDGVVWFRRQIMLPPNWAGKELTLNLGAISDLDETYFNGKEIGHTGLETKDYHRVPRQYKVPASLVKTGRNVIAIRVFNNLGRGGFGGAPDELFLSQGTRTIPLSGDWLFKVASTLPEIPLDPDDPNQPAVLYNAMIFPLIPFSIQGVIWNNGEKNLRDAGQYRHLLPLLIRCWRGVWNIGNFSFLIIQLPAGENGTSAGENAMAKIREAQAKTLSLPKTALASTIDLGQSGHFSPDDMREIARRLNMAAQGINDGKKTVYAGPVYERSAVENGKMRLFLKTNGGKLQAKDGAPKGFVIAGEDRRFVQASASLDGDTVIVWNDQTGKPEAVRYAWDDNPGGNLQNQEGLPATPFRTDNW